MADDSQLVLIEWVDRGRPMPGWQRLSHLDARLSQKCVSVGFLVREDEQTKVIAPSLGSSNGDEDWDQVSGLIMIPTSAITKMKRLIPCAMTIAPQRPPLANAEWLRRLA